MRQQKLWSDFCTIETTFRSQSQWRIDANPNILQESEACHQVAERMARRALEVKPLIQTQIATWPQYTNTNCYLAIINKKTNFICLILIHTQVGGTVTGEHGVGLGKVGTFSCKHKMLSSWQGCSTGRAVWRGGGRRDEKRQKSFGSKVFWKFWSNLMPLLNRTCKTLYLLYFV